ncbi:MAG TPA: ABC transporter substrate-binding protein [Candidatus Limnocylindrales bacterium]|nr:ABC transporter substrate-binding protein [Candidatus Limnocylindrales bacterium]
MIRIRRLLALVVVTCLGASLSSGAAELSSLRKIRVAITSISGSMVPPWAANEAGIFKKYGLQVEVIATPSGIQGTNALIANEISFLQIAGGTTTGAAVGGADLKIVATMTATLVLNLAVRPEIEKPEQLRGKNIGISRFGTSLHTGARLAAKHYGLEPGKDVHIVEIGAGDWIVGAMQGNRVQAGVFGYPATSRAVKFGNRVMLHLPSLNIPYASTGVSTRGDIIRDDPDLVRRYLSAQIEAIALMKKDRPFTLKVLSKYLRTDDMDLLNESYDIQIAKYMQKTPLPTAEAVRSVLEELTERNPKAKDLDPHKFFDDRFVRQLQAEDFIEALYR